MSHVQTRAAAPTFALFLLAIACIGPNPAAAQPYLATDAQLILTVRDFAADHGIGLTQGDFTGAALEYARAQHGQRLDPTSMNAQWAIRPEAYDAPADFSAARTREQIQAWLQGLSPQGAAYGGLLQQHRAYRAIVAAGGWPLLETGAVLREGATGSSIGALRRRLSIEGYAANTDGDPNLFDGLLADALARFQTAHALAADGVAGRETIAALNVPAQRKLRQIELNMERLRWLPRALPPTRIEVNIPTAELTYYENGAVALSMRVIVGKPENVTPNAIATIAAVTFNPAWRVPASIARNEILPLAEGNPDYLASHGYTHVDGRLVQAPGPGNALGRIKFEMPNPFDVYLHDTSSPHLFDRRRRTLSHGCVRVQRPRELAEALLGEHWPLARIDAEIDRGETHTVVLPVPVTVVLLYQTVVAELDGVAHFAPDVYGWDEELDRALSGQPAAIARLDMESETMCQHTAQRA
jgi:murein L,D-transpeptidase YcbB/YkuD